MADAAVIGIGNPLRGDDGAGAAVVARLAGRVPASVRLLLAGGGAAELLDAWDGLGHVVVIDAVRTGAAPGSLHCFDAAAGPLGARTGGPSTHGLGLAEALELGRALDRLPARVDVVGIEAASMDDGAALSPAVAGAVDAAAERVLSLLDQEDGHA